MDATWVNLVYPRQNCSASTQFRVTRSKEHNDVATSFCHKLKTQPHWEWRVELPP